MACYILLYIKMSGKVYVNFQLCLIQNYLFSSASQMPIVLYSILFYLFSSASQMAIVLFSILFYLFSSASQMPIVLYSILFYLCSSVWQGIYLFLTEVVWADRLQRDPDLITSHR